jgi:beta-xylosidase
MTYTNPVWPGYMADPFALRWRGVYYAYGTAPRDERTGRHFRLLRSEDLANWEDLGGAITPLDDPALAGVPHSLSLCGDARVVVAEKGV